MNIYFACSITGGRKDESAYQAIVNALLAGGHEVPTAGLSQPEILTLEHIMAPQEVYARDTAWIESCDALVAEVSTPSHGVGYEISYALSKGKPVLCCYRKGVRVSKMITGNSDPRLQVCPYSSHAEVVKIIEAFLGNLAATKRGYF
jgi:2'-deoxynucleoside 5'-phosphate N-hydrolase